MDHTKMVLVNELKCWYGPINSTTRSPIMTHLKLANHLDQLPKLFGTAAHISAEKIFAAHLLGNSIYLQ